MHKKSGEYEDNNIKNGTWCNSNGKSERYSKDVEDSSRLMIVREICEANNRE